MKDDRCLLERAGNHTSIFLRAGFKEYRSYRYWDAATKSLDFAGFTADLSAAPENAVIILHACAHNPTGIDPTHEQWKTIADIIEVPFFLILLFDSSFRVDSMTTSPRVPNLKRLSYSSGFVSRGLPST